MKEDFPGEREEVGTLEIGLTDSFGEAVWTLLEVRPFGLD